DQRCERTRDHLVGPARQRGQAAVAEGAPAVTIGDGHQMCSPVASRRTPESHRCSGLFGSSGSGAPPRLDSFRNGDLVRLDLAAMDAARFMITGWPSAVIGSLGPRPAGRLASSLLVAGGRPVWFGGRCAPATGRGVVDESP